MRVDQLIRALQALPLDAPVLIDCAEGGAIDIARPRLRRAALNSADFECDGGPHAFDDDGAVEVIHIAPGAGDEIRLTDLVEEGADEPR